MTTRTAPWLTPALLAVGPLIGLGWAVWAAGGGADGGFSAAAVLERLARPAPWRALAWSLYAALAATTLATVGALVVALHFRGSTRGHRAARALASVPLPIPPIVVGAAALLVLSQSGLVARLAAALGLLSEPAQMVPLLQASHGAGVILALAWKELGFLSLLACTMAAQVDPELEASARTLGASPALTRRRVVLPLIWRGITPGVVVAFTFVLGSYEIPALLGPSDPQPLAVAVLERSRDADPAARGDAWASTLLLFGAAAAAVAWHEWARRHA